MCVCTHLCYGVLYKQCLLKNIVTEKLFSLFLILYNAQNPELSLNQFLDLTIDTKWDMVWDLKQTLCQDEVTQCSPKIFKQNWPKHFEIIEQIKKKKK